MNLFDSNFYRRAYGDLKQLTNAEVMKHYMIHGSKESRLPSLEFFYTLYPDFDYIQYCKKHKIEKLPNMNIEESCAIHCFNGVDTKANHSPAPDKQHVENKFDPEFYLKKYPDLRSAGIDTEAKAIRHWNRHGKKEGRQGYLNHNNPVVVESKKQRFKIIINAQYGLSNRLRAIASGYSVAKQTGRQLVICWSPDSHCDCSFNELFKNNDWAVINKHPNLLNDYTNVAVYNYISPEGGVPNEPINTAHPGDIYIKSNCIINAAGSTNYIKEFMLKLQPVQQVDDIMNASNISNIDDLIGMHIRHGGGINSQLCDADNSNNWSAQDSILMFKHRSNSHVDNFIKQIEIELKDNPQVKFFIATDTLDNYDKLKKLFPGKIFHLQCDKYNKRDKHQLWFALADILTLSKCKKFYGSYWSSFSEIVEYFQTKNQLNIFSNNFKHNTRVNDTEPYTGNITVYHGCKNRESNLVQSIKSYADNSRVDEILVMDWSSRKNVNTYLKNNLPANHYSKVKVIRCVTKLPWMASWANNIGLYHAKNEKILKLDADNIITDHNKLFNHYGSEPLDILVHADWRDAKTKDQQHANGVFFVSKNMLNTVGYHVQEIVFYGWEDEEIKNRHKQCFKSKTIDIDLIAPIEQQNHDRLANQKRIKKEFVNTVDFYGHDLDIFSGYSNGLNPLICYNKLLIESSSTLLCRPRDVQDLFNITKQQQNYMEVEIIKEIPKFYSNINPVTRDKLSCCPVTLIPNLLRDMLWVKHPQVLQKQFVQYGMNLSSECSDYLNLLLLYIRLDTINKIEKEDNGVTLNISLYNELNVARCVEQLTCLYLNMKNKHINKINIFLEQDSSPYIVKDYIEAAIQKNKVWADIINVVETHERPTFNTVFEYCDSVCGSDDINILSNNDIYFDDTINIIKTLKHDQFICNTRVNSAGKIEKIGPWQNIFSQDVWAWRGKTAPALDVDVHIGSYMCDSYMNHVLNDIQYYKCYNLGPLLKCIHVHRSHTSETTKARDADDCTYDNITFKNGTDKAFYIINKANHKRKGELEGYWEAYGLKFSNVNEMNNSKPSKFQRWEHV